MLTVKSNLKNLTDRFRTVARDFVQLRSENIFIARRDAVLCLHTGPPSRYNRARSPRVASSDGGGEGGPPRSAIRGNSKKWGR